MSSIVIAGDTSGTVTLDAPAVAGSTVLTLPATSGAVFVGGQALSATTGSFSGNVTLGSAVLATPTGTAPIYAARAWVNFDGTTTPPTIRASGNVSSVARNATGVFTINLTTAMPNANYSVVEGGTRNPAQNNADGKTTIRDLSTSSFKVITFGSTNPVNHKIILVSVFG